MATHTSDSVPALPLVGCGYLLLVGGTGLLAIAGAAFFFGAGGGLMETLFLTTYVVAVLVVSLVAPPFVAHWLLTTNTAPAVR